MSAKSSNSNNLICNSSSSSNSSSNSLSSLSIQANSVINPAATVFATSSVLGANGTCTFNCVAISEIVDENKLVFNPKYKGACCLTCSYDSQGVVIKITLGMHFIKIINLILFAINCI